MWFIIDFMDKCVIPTHYTLRHYASFDLEALRNWRFEGSNDGSKWFLIKRHEQDTALGGIGSTYTWDVDTNGRSFCMFRILQTAKNSNGHYYLCLSGFEVYGKVCIPKPLEVPKEGKVFRYAYDFDTHGLFYWLGSRGGMTAWRNPAEADYVEVTASSLASSPPSKPASALCGRETVRCVTQPKPNQYFLVNLKRYKLQPTHYTMRHYDSWDTEALRNWQIEGSNDGRSYDVLREHINDKRLNKIGATATWSLPVKKSYQFFRIRQTGPNSNDNHYLSLSGLEMYGILTEVKKSKRMTSRLSFGKKITPTKSKSRSSLYSVDEPKRSSLKRRDSSSKVKSESPEREFVYTSDFDDRGVLYYLGTHGYTQPWQNPAVIGAVSVSSSPLASKPPCSPSSAIVGREIVRCVTVPGKDAWFAVDFLQHRLRPTAYTLRHYSSWDTECLRDWKLQASNDGKKWTKLLSHKKDCSLNKRGDSHTWAIPRTKKPYRLFRILQTGKNSNGHWYLALSGFEIYGTLSAVY